MGRPPPAAPQGAGGGDPAGHPAARCGRGHGRHRLGRRHEQDGVLPALHRPQRPVCRGVRARGRADPARRHRCPRRRLARRAGRRGRVAAPPDRGGHRPGARVDGAQQPPRRRLGPGRGRNGPGRSRPVARLGRAHAPRGPRGTPDRPGLGRAVRRVDRPGRHGGEEMSTLSTALRTAIDGRWAHVREEARSELEPARFAPPTEELTLEEYRARVAQQLRELAETGHPARALSKDLGGHADLSLLVKAGVHWGLFGGAVANLGTQRHHTAYLPRILSAELPGCFAMTETGHGSDVQSLQTTATYDPETDEIVVNTPSVAARKDYIGGAARDGRLAAVFAQLVT